MLFIFSVDTFSGNNSVPIFFLMNTGFSVTNILQMVHCEVKTTFWSKLEVKTQKNIKFMGKKNTFLSLKNLGICTAAYI